MTLPKVSRHRVLAAVALSVVAVGCGHAPEGPAKLDGVYRLTTSGDELARFDAPAESDENWGTWTLVLNHGRFAFTRENDRVCTWAYGALELGNGHVMAWTVIDGGGTPPGAAANQPDDSYGFRWSRYQDVLTLTAAKGRPAGYFGVKPWRRIADTPTAKYLSSRCPPPAAAIEPSGAEKRARSPAPDATIELSGDLVRTPPTTWMGSVVSKQLGPGRLSIEGGTDFSPSASRTRLTFAARFSTGELRGCSITAILRRPHGRYLWESSGGQVTGTSPALREYLGLPVGIHGVTMTRRLNHMHGGLGSPPVARHEGAAETRDLC